MPGAGPQGQEGLEGHAAIPVQALPQPGVGLGGEPGDRCDAFGCLPGAPHGTGAQGLHPLAAQPPAGPRGLLPAHRREPGITRQALFLAVLNQVGHGHVDDPARPERLSATYPDQIPVNERSCRMARTSAAQARPCQVARRSGRGWSAGPSPAPGTARPPPSARPAATCLWHSPFSIWPDRAGEYSRWLSAHGQRGGRPRDDSDREAR